MPHRPYIVSVRQSLRAGASPFDFAELWEKGHDAAHLSPSSESAWRQYQIMCLRYSRATLPITVTALVAYMLWYVCVKENNSANLNSEMLRLSSYCSTKGIPWPDFLTQGSGDSLSARIAKMQKDWPSQVIGAPALTLQAGLKQAILYLKTRGRNLWALQNIAIMSTMYEMLLRPSEIIPLDHFTVAEGTTSGFNVSSPGRLLLP